MNRSNLADQIGATTIEHLNALINALVIATQTPVEALHAGARTTLKAPKPGAPADIVLSVDGKEVARTTAKMTVPAAFTASESFDVGVDLGSTVSRDYFERRPFRFDGRINKVDVQLK